MTTSIRCLAVLGLLIAVGVASCATTPEPVKATNLKSDLEAKFDQLEEATCDQVLFYMVDMLVAHGYALSTDVATLVKHLSDTHGVQDFVLHKYLGKRQLNASARRVIFPLLDILIRIEDRTGTSNLGIRRLLWRRWNQEFSFEMVRVIGFGSGASPSRLASLERDIRNSQGWNDCVALIARLAEQCEKSSLMAGELDGFEYLYSPPEGINRTIKLLARHTHPRVDSALRTFFVYGENLPYSPNLLYAFLDVLMRCQRRTGIDTTELRQALWAKWLEKFEGQRRPRMANQSHYESDIRRSSAFSERE